MKIYNTTNQVQELRVLDKITKRQFSLYVSARSLFEVSHTINVLNLGKLIEDRIFVVYEGAELYASPKSVEETESGVESEVPTPEDNKESEVTDTADNKFVCEICGVEFASARGLASHMKRSHGI